MKKYMILNTTPFWVWILWFFCQFNDIFLPAIGVKIQLGLLFCMPVVFAVVNIVVAKDKTKFLYFNSVFSIAQVFGYYLSGVLYYNFISNDSETELVTNTITFISIIYTTAITLICFIIKAILKKKKA